MNQPVLCHLCQSELEHDAVHVGGLSWCRDLIECKFRARLRLGVGYAKSLRAKAFDLRVESSRVDERAQHIAETPPPVPDDVYLNVIRSPQWEAFTNEQKLWAKHKCEWCGSVCFDLEVHHLHYKTLGAELPEDVLVLCPIHHRELDRLRKSGKMPPVVIRVENNGVPHRVVTRAANYVDPAHQEIPY